MDYIILAVYEGHDGILDSNGNYELQRMDYLVTSSAVPATLPECLPGSRKVNAAFLRDSTDAAAYIAVKQLDGAWL